MKTATKCCVAIALIACVLFAVGGFDTQAVGGGSAPWYDGSWARRQPITIDHNQVVGDLTDFPVLLTEANVRASLFTHAKSDGSDIVVTTSDGVTRLKRELVGFDNVANKLELYVKVPLLSSSADTILYVYYDNPSASLTDDDDTWDDHYVMVQHMEDATPTTILGSTSNHYVGTKGDVPHPDPQYRVNPSVEVDGKIGNAQEFDRSWIDVGVHADFNLRQYFTVEVWAYPVRPYDQYNGALVSHDMLSTGRQWDAPILMDGLPPQVTLQVRKYGSDCRVHAGLPNYDDWNHIAAVYNYTDPKLLFLNGVKHSRPGDGQLDDAPNTPLVIGTHYKFNWENHPSFLGVIEEVRISNVARSDAWILTGRNNQLDPSAFCSAGDEELLVITVDIDIKPGSCPNPFNTESKGVLPVAVLGTEDFHVTTIDPATIQLTREGYEVGVSPLRWDYEDVATPFEGELCECDDLNGDGYVDLTLKFDTQEVKDTLSLETEVGNTILLLVTGNLKEEADGTPIEGSDCIWVLQTGKK